MLQNIFIINKQPVLLQTAEETLQKHPTPQTSSDRRKDMNESEEFLSEAPGHTDPILWSCLYSHLTKHVYLLPLSPFLLSMCPLFISWSHYLLPPSPPLLTLCPGVPRGGGDSGEVLRHLPDPGLFQKVQKEKRERSSGRRRGER